MTGRRVGGIRAALGATVCAASLACALLEPAPADLLRQSADNFRALTSYHSVAVAQLVIRDGETIGYELMTDVERPEKWRSVVTSSVGAVSDSTELVLIGAHTYWHRPQEGWLEQETDPAVDRSGGGGLMRTITNPSKMRELVEVDDRQQVDGQPTRHLRYTVEPTEIGNFVFGTAGLQVVPSPLASAMVEVWIRTLDRHVARLRYSLVLVVEGDLETALGGGAPKGDRATLEYQLDETYTRRNQPPDTPIVGPVSATLIPRRSP
jgi:hypothetical protein